MSKRKVPTTKAIRARRSLAAESRQADYDTLTTQQKIDHLPKDGAKKQRAKLTLRLEEEKNGTAKKPAEKASEGLKAKDRREQEQRGD